MRKTILALSLVIAGILLVSCAPPSDGSGAMAGQAIQAAAGGGQNLVFVDNTKLNNFFRPRGNDLWETDVSGNDLCKQLGYKGCFAAEWRAETSYSSTNDGSCSGEIQMLDYDAYLVPCEFTHAGKPCFTRGADAHATEPYLGDYNEWMVIDSLICTK